MDAAAEEARLGTQGAFNYNRWASQTGREAWVTLSTCTASAQSCTRCHILDSLPPLPLHRTNPLPADAVLVDEASMLSLPLAAALMDALKPKCQLVLVGDVDQLPPVGEC